MDRTTPSSSCPGVVPTSGSRGPRPPTFMPGYVDARKPTYMNVGYLRSPYPGKTGHGDYGPRLSSSGGNGYYGNQPFGTGWHNPWNPVYYTPKDFSSATLKIAKIEGSYDDGIPFCRRPVDY